MASPTVCKHQAVHVLIENHVLRRHFQQRHCNRETISSILIVRVSLLKKSKCFFLLVFDQFVGNKRNSTQFPFDHSFFHVHNDCWQRGVRCLHRNDGMNCSRGDNMLHIDVCLSWRPSRLKPGPFGNNDRVMQRLTCFYKTAWCYNRICVLKPTEESGGCWETSVSIDCDWLILWTEWT